MGVRVWPGTLPLRVPSTLDPQPTVWHQRSGSSSGLGEASLQHPAPEASPAQRTPYAALQPEQPSSVEGHSLGPGRR